MVYLPLLVDIINLPHAPWALYTVDFVTLKANDIFFLTLAAEIKVDR